MARALTPGLQAFDTHFVAQQLATLYGISFLDVRPRIIWDDAMFMLLGEQKKTAYLKRLHQLSNPDSKKQGA